MRGLNQLFAVIGLTIRTLPQRAGSSAVAVIGIAGVVVVFVAVLSIAEGFQRGPRRGRLAGHRHGHAWGKRLRDELRPVDGQHPDHHGRPWAASERLRGHRVRGALRDHQPTAPVHRHRRQRPAPWRAAGRVRRAGRCHDHRRAPVSAGHERGHRGSECRRAVRRARPGHRATLGREHLDRGRDLRGGRVDRRVRNLVRRPGPATRLPARRHVSVGIRQARRPGERSSGSRTR